MNSDETVASGETLTFNGHLVDIGSLEGENKPESQLNVDKKQKNVFRFRTPGMNSLIIFYKFIARYIYVSKYVRISWSLLKVVAHRLSNI